MKCETRAAERRLVDASLRYRAAESTQASALVELEELERRYWEVFEIALPCLRSQAFRFARAVCARETALEVAESGLSEALVRGHPGIRSFRPELANSERPALAWFARVLRNSILTELTKHTRNNEITHRAAERARPDRKQVRGGRSSGLAAEPPEAERPERLLEVKRVRERLRAAATTPAQRRYFQGLVLVSEGWNWQQAHRTLRFGGDAEAYRRSSRRWARKVLRNFDLGSTDKVDAA